MANELAAFFPTELQTLQQLCLSMTQRYDGLANSPYHTPSKGSKSSILATYQQSGYLRKYLMTWFYPQIAQVNQYACAVALNVKLAKIKQRIASAREISQDPYQRNDERLDRAITHLLHGANDGEALVQALTQSIQATATLFGNAFHTKLLAYQAPAQAFNIHYQTQATVWSKNHTLLDNPLVDWFKTALGIAEPVTVHAHVTKAPPKPSLEVEQPQQATFAITSVSTTTQATQIEVPIDLADLTATQQRQVEDLAKHAEQLTRQQTSIVMCTRQLRANQGVTQAIAADQQQMFVINHQHEQAIHENAKKSYAHTQALDRNSQALVDIRTSTDVLKDQQVEQSTQLIKLKLSQQDQAQRLQSLDEQAKIIAKGVQQVQQESQAIAEQQRRNRQQSAEIQQELVEQRQGIKALQVQMEQLQNAWQPNRMGIR